MIERPHRQKVDKVADELLALMTGDQGQEKGVAVNSDRRE